MLCTSGFVDDVMFSHIKVPGPESKTIIIYVSSGTSGVGTGTQYAISETPTGSYFVLW